MSFSFKPKTVLCRSGQLELQIPQTRGVEFYPSALERGERSARALKPVAAEMYVLGVSTRKVAALSEQPCGSEVSVMQVIRAAEIDAPAPGPTDRPGCFVTTVGTQTSTDVTETVGSDSAELP